MSSTEPQYVAKYAVPLKKKTTFFEVKNWEFLFYELKCIGQSEILINQLIHTRVSLKMEAGRRDWKEP